MILSEDEAVAQLIGLREDLRRAGIGAPARSTSTDSESTVGSSVPGGKARPNSREEL